jgi:hypothetical protein
MRPVGAKPCFARGSLFVESVECGVRRPLLCVVRLGWTKHELPPLFTRLRQVKAGASLPACPSPPVVWRARGQGSRSRGAAAPRSGQTRFRQSLLLTSA